MDKKEKYRLIEDGNENFFIQKRIWLFWITVWSSEEVDEIIYIDDAKAKLAYYKNKDNLKILK